jgi:hypothetical protein
MFIVRAKYENISHANFKLLRERRKVLGLPALILGARIA